MSATTNLALLLFAAVIVSVVGFLVYAMVLKRKEKFSIEKEATDRAAEVFIQGKGVFVPDGRAHELKEDVWNIEFINKENKSDRNWFKVDLKKDLDFSNKIDIVLGRSKPQVILTKVTKSVIDGFTPLQLQQQAQASAEEVISNVDRQMQTNVDNIAKMQSAAKPAPTEAEKK